MVPIISDTVVPPMPESFWVSLADRGISLAIACFFAYLFAQWFQKMMTARDAVQTSKDGLYQQIIDQMSARLSTSEVRLAAAEKRIDDCEQDRRDLRAKLEGRQ